MLAGEPSNPIDWRLTTGVVVVYFGRDDDDASRTVGVSFFARVPKVPLSEGMISAVRITRLSTMLEICVP